MKQSKLNYGLSKLNDSEGVTIIVVALFMVVLIGVAAFVIDLAHLYIVKNELQNAADAGALRGARVLYSEDGTVINSWANGEAKTAATDNLSDNIEVEVNWESGNGPDVERGHWNIANRTFTPNPSTVVVDLWDDDVSNNPDFINAVRVVSRRQATPALSFFAKIFGFNDFELSAEAIAYIGFAGKIEPYDAEQPIAICQQAILDSNDHYTCGIGRMIHSGSGSGHQTGGWTNFTQGPCDTASANTVRPLVCGDGNPNPLNFGEGMGTTGGEVQSAFDDLIDCWKNPSSGLDTNEDGWPDRPWVLTLPVIDCPGNNTSNCATVVGVVTLNILWITRNDKNQFNEVPRKMQVSMDTGTISFSCDESITGSTCWNNFVTTFNLRDVLMDTSATYEDKTIYFLPDCNAHYPTGVTGEKILAYWQKYQYL